jgi:hypothetical protein
VNKRWGRLSAACGTQGTDKAGNKRHRFTETANRRAPDKRQVIRDNVQEHDPLEGQRYTVQSE